VILYWFIFARIGRAGQALWTVIGDRPTSRRVPWRYLRRRALRSPRMWLQLATIFAVLVVYPASFFVSDETTRDSIIGAIIVLWLVTAIVPLAGRVLSMVRGRRRRRS
jgi:hypothetical protein